MVQLKSVNCSTLVNPITCATSEEKIMFLICNLSNLYPTGRKAIKDARLFQEFLEISQSQPVEIRKYFQHLRNIMLINTFENILTDGRTNKLSQLHLKKCVA